MRTEHIYDHPSIEGSEGLLAMILHRCWEKHEPGKMFVSDPANSLQVGRMTYATGDKVDPHVHNCVKRLADRTEEVLVIFDGVVRLSIFNSTGLAIRDVTLMAGDVVILLAGGHSLEAMTRVEMLEVKTGPYLGRDVDKRVLPTQCPQEVNSHASL